jgi:hypothetical protein
MKDLRQPGFTVCSKSARTLQAQDGCHPALEIGPQGGPRQSKMNLASLERDTSGAPETVG